LPGRIAIVPGLSDEHAGVPDVMRGEEVQIFGAIALTGLDDGLFVLPGTHNKWARVKSMAAWWAFRTFMTGEFYALLSTHSILARTLDASAPLDEAAFLRGVARRPRTAKACCTTPLARARCRCSSAWRRRRTGELSVRAC
jgi:2-dehydro-3-deoxygalactonokinase